MFVSGIAWISAPELFKIILTYKHRKKNITKNFLLRTVQGGSALGVNSNRVRDACSFFMIEVLLNIFLVGLQSIYFKIKTEERKPYLWRNYKKSMIYLKWETLFIRNLYSLILDKIVFLKYQFNCILMRNVP